MVQRTKLLIEHTLYRNIAIDRRVIRTRKGIQDALIFSFRNASIIRSLLRICAAQSMPSAKIFYTHYVAKDALRPSGLEVLHKE